MKRPVTGFTPAQSLLSCWPRPSAPDALVRASHFVHLATAILICSAALGDEQPVREAAEASQDVSYYRDVLPILQTHCTGCHQPAKASGDYAMTSFERLLSGGESGSPAIVPGDPDGSYLVDLITPTDGQADMPSGKPPLEATSIELIRRWIEQGAKDDSPQTVQQNYDIDHPPTYTSPPVITSLDCSPDGKFVAVAGNHEVLLHHLDGTGLAARLIGTAERIESVAFSPDGTKLAVVGGLPARRGELQIWNVTAPPDPNASWQPNLLVSIPVTFDTIYGGHWSPDGKLVAVGCADNTLRAFDTETGDQVLFQGAHGDWVLDTTFSADGSHLISVSRDMTAKLTEVSTQRFVDNITSITPGALKGGILAVARHPQRDEIVIGGSDGVPKVYRVFRQTERRIGDDANLIRQLEPLPGRVFSVAVSQDGRRIAAGSSLDGAGRVTIDSYEFDTSLPEDIKQIVSKVSTSRSPEEVKRLEQYNQDGVRRLAQLDLPASIYAVSFVPGQDQLVAAGSDGIIRVINVQQAAVERQFPAIAELTTRAPLADTRPHARHEPTAASPSAPDLQAESLPDGAVVERLTAQPDQVHLASEFDYVQLLVTATLSSGEQFDVTRMVTIQVPANIISVSPTGLVQGLADGEASLQLSLGGQSLTIPVSVQGLSVPLEPDFVRDVAPVVAKMGCNQGTCHGAAQGRNGFKLSLRGYDAIADVRALTDDHASRRTNIASPENSLMLLKATATVPHMGGRLTGVGEDYYALLRQWLAGGAKLSTSAPPVTAIHVTPENPTIALIGGMQQVRVVATFADGLTRDVTREAFITSGNSEVATSGEQGLMTALRRGEASVLARYQGAYAATTLTVMGDRSGFQWQDPPELNQIDALVADKWQRLKIEPAPLCTDSEFVRRVSLDLTGLPPSAEATEAFLSDPRESRVKRDELVDRLIGSDEFVDYWTNKWADLLQVNGKFLSPDGAAAYRQWIRQQVAENRPYDQFVRSILTASGSNRDNPPASYYKILRTPEDMAETTTQLFLAIRFNCNKCHDHPFERWTQDQYYQTSAYFAQVALEPDPESKGRTIGGTAVDGATPLYEAVSDKSATEVVNLRTGQPAAPEFPYDCQWQAESDSSRRAQLAAWLTSKDNPYFARSYVNRLWGYLLGTGIIEPIDDIRAGNPPTNPELLDYLTEQFLHSGFDMRHVLRLICTSRTYQLSVATNRWNEDDQLNYSHARPRRLPAEVLFDTVHYVTGSVSRIPGVEPGTRAVQLPDVGISLPSGFLSTLGRPPRESACECERVSDIQLGPVMAMISGPVVAEAIADPQNALTTLVNQQPDDQQVIDSVFLRILNRHAGDNERAAVQQLLTEIDSDHQQLTQRLQAAEQQWAERKPQLEAERKEQLAKAQADLNMYEEQIAPQVAELERQRTEAIAKADAAVNEFDSHRQQQLEQLAQQQQAAAQWYPLRPAAATASNGAMLTVLDDRSLLAEGKADKGTYTVTFHTNLTNITGLRLETIPVEGIPGGGPGLPENGNFVVTEFEVLAADAATPEQFQPVALQSPVADFSQAGFDINQVIDGVKQDQLGWAVHPAGGTVHWATFQTKEPLPNAGGIVLQVNIHQFHDAKDHRLARFRISVTTSAGPIGLGLPESLAAILATEPSARNEAQQRFVADYIHKSNSQYRQLQEALAAAQQPLPVDPGVQQRQTMIEDLSRETADDPQLVQLRADVAASTQQMGQRRLTAVQDLAWALINSPAFLFNH